MRASLVNKFTRLRRLSEGSAMRKHLNNWQRHLLVGLASLGVFLYIARLALNGSDGLTGSIKHIRSRGQTAAGYFTADNEKMSSYYAKWIAEDFSIWRRSGITQAMVEAALTDYPECRQPANLRFQIINGTLWIDHITLRPANGWYPAELGPGWSSAKGRVPYTILTLMDILRSYPGQVPDVDAVVEMGDLPCIPKSKRGMFGQYLVPAPIFSYDSDDAHADIPFPDFSYYGHEQDRLAVPGPGSTPVFGWPAQFEHLLEASANLSFVNRHSQVVWRGRHGPGRDWVRQRFVNCRGDMEKANRSEDAALFCLYQPDVPLNFQYLYRYVIYIESMAWATNFKHKLASGSVPFAIGPDYYEFFARALQPGVHYIPITTGPRLCDDIVEKIRAMEDFTADYLAQKEAAADRSLTLEEWFAGITSGQTQGVRGGFTDYAPWELGRNAQQFLAEHVTMDDVREYLWDVLKMYSSLQNFEVKPSPRSQCYSGKMLIGQFAFPHEKDGESVASMYPWLKDFDPCLAAGHASDADREAVVAR